MEDDIRKWIGRRQSARLQSVCFRLSVAISLILCSSFVGVVPAQETETTKSETPSAKTPSEKTPSEKTPSAKTPSADTPATDKSSASTKVPLASKTVASEATTSDASESKTVNSAAESKWLDLQVEVAFGESSLFTPEFRDEVLGKVHEGVDQTYGQVWNVTVHENDWLNAAEPESLAQLSALSVKYQMDQATVAPDKMFLIVVYESKANRHQVAGREWDRPSHTLGPVLVSEPGASDVLGPSVTGLVQNLFRKIPSEFVPYAVCIEIAFDQNPLFTSHARNEVLTQVDKAANRTFGQMWNVTVHENDWLSPVRSETLDRWDANSFEQQMAEQENQSDKVFLIVIEESGSCYRVTGREWDRASQTLGSSLQQVTYVRGDLGVEAFRMVRTLFRPVLELVESADDMHRLRLRAGELLPADSPDAELPAGTLLQPFFRYLNRDRQLRQIQFLPWTYLRVNSRDRAMVNCELVSGLRSPLGTGRRRRVEAMAIVMHPTFRETRLTLVNQRNRTKPLVGYQVLVVNRPPKLRSAAQTEGEEKPAPEPLRMLSDRDGTVTVPVDNDTPVRWVYVRSGGSILARVPLVPGVEADMSIAVPDDSLQLLVQGQLARLQTELINTVARRAILIALLKRFGESGKWKQADKVLADLETVRTSKDFQKELQTTIRFPAVKMAKDKRLRMVESRIEKMCRETSALITRHLDDAKLRDVKSEIEELRKLDASDKK